MTLEGSQQENDNNTSFHPPSLGSGSEEGQRARQLQLHMQLTSTVTTERNFSIIFKLNPASMKFGVWDFAKKKKQKATKLPTLACKGRRRLALSHTAVHEGCCALSDMPELPRMLHLPPGIFLSGSSQRAGKSQLVFSTGSSKVSF